MSRNWHEEHPGNLYQLCDWLVSWVGFEAVDVLQAVQKPWNWEREWGLCELYYNADGNEDIQRRCIEAVDEYEYETTAEMVAAEFEVTL